MKLNISNNACGLSLLSVGAMALGYVSCAPDDAGKKNVLFIMVDDLKPSLGCYGDQYAITPCTDTFASDATVYRRAYCQQALSGPSRASILTGMRPDANGVTELNTWIREKEPDLVTLPQAFLNAGYVTASVGKTFHGTRNTLDSLSWSVAPALYEYGKTDEYMFPENRTGRKAASSEFYGGSEDDYLDMRIRNEALKRLDELSCGKKPFFLAVGFLKPHLPFCAPERFKTMYDDVRFDVTDASHIEGAPALAYHDSNELRGYVDVGKSEIDHARNIELKKAYYSCVSFADENIGAVIGKLKELDLYDNTVIVLVGDHGYHTGEQGLWCKSTNYEAACHSPLIIRDPGQSGGKMVDAPVELIDIFPTLTSMCGIGTPPGVQGKNLSDLDDKARYHAVSQFPRPYQALHKASRRTHMGYTVRDAGWRYVEWYDNSGVLAEKELYHMEDSALESVNLAGRPEYADEEKRLKLMLSGYHPYKANSNKSDMKQKLLSNPNYVKALEYIETHDLTVMENGTYEIDGDNLYVNIVDSKLRPREKARLEVHDRYIDIQIPLSGDETFGVKPRSLCAGQDGQMNVEKDIMFFADPVYDLMTVKRGEVVVFAPEEAHAPLIGDGMIHKAIFKVKVQ